MNIERTVTELNAFIESARTALDNAELYFAGAPDADKPAVQINKGLSLLLVASHNVKWCSQHVLELAERMLAESLNATAVDGAASRDAMEAGQKTSGNRVP